MGQTRRARIALLSTSDTDLLSARASGADFVLANPSRPGYQSMAETIEGCDLVVGRVLGSPQDLCDGFARIRGTGVPVVVLGGEQQPSAELMEISSVPIGVAAEAHRYLAEGGPENLRQLHAFLSDTVLLTGEGFEPPVAVPQCSPCAGAAAGRGALLPRPRGVGQRPLRPRPGRRDRRDG